MAFEDISDPAAVRRAIDEFKAIGQSAFLAKYGFGASRGWMLRDNDGQEYDAKAILGAAHGYQHPALGPLQYDHFYGGVPTARKLRELGFTVTEPDRRRNPIWKRDELILALDLYMRRRPSFPDDRPPEVIELSQLLNRLAALDRTISGDNFRNANGVAMKLQNFRRLDPSQEGKGLSGGGKGEAEVWTTFAEDLERLQSTVAAIRATVSAFKNGYNQEPEDSDGGEEAEEGKVLTRLHRSRERDRRIVKLRKDKALREHGTLHCEACGFNFSSQYGKRGSGFIECHHTKPVSMLKPGEKTKLVELALLCANCHRMVHVRRPWMTVDELRELLRAPQ
jgi:5-methylcytosine-specific restriction protein A